MSIGRAQAQALRERHLDDFGTEPGPGELPIIAEVLGMAAKEFIDEASENLDKSNSVSTGGLSRSLTFSVVSSGDLHVMTVGYPAGSKAAKYYDYNNKGVQGVGKAGKAPRSPYKFRFLSVSEKHAAAIKDWYEHNGKSVTNVAPKYPASGLEGKRVTVSEALKAAKKTDALSSLAYATAMKMKRDGLAPSRFFDDAVASALGDDLREALSVALGGEVIMRLRRYGE